MPQETVRSAPNPVHSKLSNHTPYQSQKAVQSHTARINHTYHFDVVNRWCVLPVLFPSCHRSSNCAMKAVQPSVCQAGNMRQCQAFMGKTSLHAAHMMVHARTLGREPFLHHEPSSSWFASFRSLPTVSPFGSPADGVTVRQSTTMMSEANAFNRNL